VIGRNSSLRSEEAARPPALRRVAPRRICDGRFAIRVAHTNHRTRQEDLDLLVESVLKLGRSITITQGRSTSEFESTERA
jgi:hypothetical protein